jgi:hypothetical protein
MGKSDVTSLAYNESVIVGAPACGPEGTQHVTEPLSIASNNHGFAIWRGDTVHSQR